MKKLLAGVLLAGVVISCSPIQAQKLDTYIADVHHMQVHKVIDETTICYIVLSKTGTTSPAISCIREN